MQVVLLLFFWISKKQVASLPVEVFCYVFIKYRAILLKMASKELPKKEELYSDIYVMHINFMCTDAKGLSSPSEVELLREKVYASLEAYCKQRYPDQQGR